MAEVVNELECQLNVWECFIEPVESHRQTVHHLPSSVDVNQVEMEMVVVFICILTGHHEEGSDDKNRSVAATVTE